MKLNFILIGLVLSIFENTPISNAGPTDTSKCLYNEKDCRCEADKEIIACEVQIPTTEENAKIKLLFGYPSNRYIAQNPANKNSCDTPKRCVTYLTTLKTLESGYQSCKYAKKKITTAQREKVRGTYDVYGNVSGSLPEYTYAKQAKRRTKMVNMQLYCRMRTGSNVFRARNYFTLQIKCLYMVVSALRNWGVNNTNPHLNLF